MKRWISTFVVLGVLLFGAAAIAQGQVEIDLNGESASVAAGTTLLDLVHRLGREADDVDVIHNGNEVHDRNLNDVTVREGDRVSIVESDETNRYTLGIGFGLVKLDQPDLEDDVENYSTASLRIAFGDQSAHRGGRRGLRGYLEPEIGVWDGARSSDTLVGVNIIGSIPFNAVDFFVGAGVGYHMLSADSFTTGEGTVVPSSDEDVIGVNAQFGVDVHLNHNVTVFGTGRFDIVNDANDSLEAKVYLGLRFGF
jgi:sulfur carrier protein ThiS